MGLETNLPLVTLYGRAGLGWLDDADITELLLGARIGVGLVGLFAEYRMLTLDPGLWQQKGGCGLLFAARLPRGGPQTVINPSPRCHPSVTPAP